MSFLISTSRKPSRRTRSLAKELEFIFGGYYLQRGKLPENEIFEIAKELGLERVLLIKEEFGNPHIFEFYFTNKKPCGLFLKAKSVKLARELNRIRSIYSSSLVICSSKYFSIKPYIKILQSLTGFPYIDNNKEKLLQKYTTIVNIEKPLSKKSLFKICFYSKVNECICKIGPELEIEGFL